MEQSGVRGASVVATPAAAAAAREVSDAGNKEKSQRRHSMSGYVRPGRLLLSRPVITPRRPYSAYTKRDGEAENTPKYDEERTNREWWRFYIKETPIPGAYQIGGFVDDLHKTRCSYRFRDTSRAKSASHQKFVGTGQMLIPGRYDMEDFLQDTSKRPLTYGFKAVEREQGPKIGQGCLDKVPSKTQEQRKENYQKVASLCPMVSHELFVVVDNTQQTEVNTSPTQYNVVDYQGGAGERASKTYHFKSHVARDVRLAHQFRVVPGPGPGLYDSSTAKDGPSISSSFKSKVSRFASSHTKVPGPGTYSYNDSTFGIPKPVPAAAIMHMKKKHGLSVS